MKNTKGQYRLKTGLIYIGGEIVLLILGPNIQR